MSKPNKRKSRPSWFQKQIERYGENFLSRINSTDIQREANSILRDIMRGNITRKDYEYLFTMKTLEAIKLAIYEKYVDSYVLDSSILYVMQSNGTHIMENMYKVDSGTMQKVYNKNKNNLIAYTTILQNIDDMISFVVGKYDHSIENCESVLYSVQNKIGRFRYII